MDTCGNSIKGRVDSLKPLIRTTGPRIHIWLAALGLTAQVYLFNYQIDLKLASLNVAYLLLIPIVLVCGFRLSDLNFAGLLSCLLIMLSLTQLIQGPPEFDLIRMGFGILLFVFSSFALIRLLDLSAIDDHQTTFHFIGIFLWIHVALQIGQLIWILIGGEAVQASYIPGIPRTWGLMGETSHFSIMFAPLIFIAVFDYKRFKELFGVRALVAMTLSTFFLGINASSFAVLLFAALLRGLWLWRVSRIIVPLAAVALFVGLSVALVPFIAERMQSAVYLLLNPSDAEWGGNISSLVLLKGAEMALAGISHFPLGVGLLNFQSLIVYSPTAKLSDIIYQLNTMDGSSLLFKGIGEFGYLYIFFLASVATQLFKRLPYLHDNTALIEAACLFSVLSASVRGASYFTGAATIGIAIALRCILTRKCRRVIPS